MNFFERQVQARRMSTRLLVLFGLAVVGIVLAVDAAVWIAWGPRDGGPPSPGVLAFASIATLAVIGLGSLYRIASLRSGGDAVAAQLGGVPVPEDTTDLSLRRLRNVVEEIAIASGVPMPALFVLEHEAGINAFAAGYAPSDAAVAVTRGALDRLNRDELQGVIAHEFSHILNGDMRLNIRLMGLLFGILMLGLIGRKVLYLGSGGRRAEEDRRPARWGAPGRPRGRRGGQPHAVRRRGRFQWIVRHASTVDRKDQGAGTGVRRQRA